MTDATESNFEFLIKYPGKVLVDFYRPSCAPCRALEPSLKSLEEKAGGGLIIIRVNVDSLPAVAATYGVQSLPALILFEKGTPRRQLTSAPTLKALEQFVR